MTPPSTFYRMSPSGTPTLSGAARARMIAERQRRSPVWRLIHLLASLKLALLLIATIAIACAVATFTESHFDASVARAWIYKAPWFIAWLGILCINLFAVTLSRWPWQKPHTGFIITHYGIILLLIGAVVGSKFGFEGNVTLRTDGQPQRRIVTDKSTLQIESPADSYLYLLPFDAKLTHPTQKHPTVLTIPGTRLEMVIDDSSEHLVQRPILTPATGNEAGEAVLLNFSSSNLKQSFHAALGTGNASPATQDFFGLATIKFFHELPQSDTDGSIQPIVVTAGAPPQEGISLSKDGSLVTLRSPDATSATFRVSEVIDQEIALGALKATVKKSLPTKQRLSELPSIKVLLSTGHTNSSSDEKPWLAVAPGPDPESALYKLGKSGQILSSGVIRKGQALPLGWADWGVELLETGSNHRVTSVVVPGDKNEQGGLPGFRAYLRDQEKNSSTPVWVVSGDVTPLVLDEALVRVGYGLELRPIPFSIALTDFQVPRDEGTETPSDFQARVLFKDTQSGTEKSGLIHMNHPASFPGGFLANMTGLNYKFSQAEWNPRDLKETTLQVLYDPGWCFKWIGSLAICLGIATMFYIRPRKD